MVLAAKNRKSVKFYENLVTFMDQMKNTDHIVDTCCLFQAKFLGLTMWLNNPYPFIMSVV